MTAPTNQASESKQMASPPPDPPPTSTPPPAPPVKNGSRRRAVIWLTLTLLIIGLVWFLLWFYHFRFYEYTDDAYVNGYMVNVTSVVPGAPTAFFADDTDLVEEGQLLAILDSTSYEIQLHNQLYTLASTTQQVKQLYDNVKVSEANLRAAEIALQRAKYDYEIRERISGGRSISQEEVTHAKDTLSTSEANVLVAQHQLQAAKDVAGVTEPAKHPLIEAQKARVREAYYNLQHCYIYAPTTGYVAQRNIVVGQWINNSVPIMAIIPTVPMWIDANYKETQLTNMRVGQPATITTDIYGSDVEYKGKVIGIASGTGSVFSLIPPQNATGNWIKIVQRLPVRIALEPEQLEKYPLRLGLSVYSYVNVTDTSLPMLAQTPSTSARAKTKVFEIDYNELNQHMDAIVAENL